MNRISTVIAIAGVMLIGARALAVDSANQSTMSKHQQLVQIVGCMKKQMSSSNSISYNAAMKVCKAQLSQQSGDTASRTLVASDRVTKPQIAR